MLHVELQVNDRWLAFIKESKYDTFNFQFNRYEEPVISINYELSYLIVHGSCYEIIDKHYLGHPPNGLQLIMGRRILDHIDDSIVMQNMGYYQLKTDSPGLWYIDIMPGEFKEQYQMEFNRKRQILLFDHPYKSNFLPVTKKDASTLPPKKERSFLEMIGSIFGYGQEAAEPEAAVAEVSFDQYALAAKAQRSFVAAIKQTASRYDKAKD